MPSIKAYDFAQDTSRTTAGSLPCAPSRAFRAYLGLHRTGAASHGGTVFAGKKPTTPGLCVVPPKRPDDETVRLPLPGQILHQQLLEPVQADLRAGVELAHGVDRRVERGLLEFEDRQVFALDLVVEL